MFFCSSALSVVVNSFYIHITLSFFVFPCLHLHHFLLPSSPHLTLPHPTLPYVTLFHSSVRSDYTFNTCLFPNLTRLLTHKSLLLFSLSHPSPHPYVSSFVLLPLFLIVFSSTPLPPPIHLTFPTRSCTPYPPLTHHPNLHHPSPNLTPHPTSPLPTLLR
jgi:hypothetical protein